MPTASAEDPTIRSSSDHRVLSPHSTVRPGRRSEASGESHSQHRIAQTHDPLLDLAQHCGTGSPSQPHIEQDVLSQPSSAAAGQDLQVDEEIIDQPVCLWAPRRFTEKCEIAGLEPPEWLLKVLAHIPDALLFEQCTPPDERAGVRRFAAVPAHSAARQRGELHLCLSALPEKGEGSVESARWVGTDTGIGAAMGTPLDLPSQPPLPQSQERLESAALLPVLLKALLMGTWPQPQQRTAAPAKHLYVLPLVSLDLSGQPVGGDGMQELCTRMRQLRAHCRLETLTLRSCCLGSDDQGAVPQLRMCPPLRRSLRRLDLSGNPLVIWEPRTWHPMLRDMARLSELDVRCTGLDEAAFVALAGMLAGEDIAVRLQVLKLGPPAAAGGGYKQPSYTSLLLLRLAVARLLAQDLRELVYQGITEDRADCLLGAVLATPANEAGPARDAEAALATCQQWWGSSALTQTCRALMDQPAQHAPGTTRGERTWGGAEGTAAAASDGLHHPHPAVSYKLAPVPPPRPAANVAQTLREDQDAGYAALGRSSNPPAIAGLGGPRFRFGANAPRAERPARQAMRLRPTYPGGVNNDDGDDVLRASGAAERSHSRRDATVGHSSPDHCLRAMAADKKRQRPVKEPGLAARGSRKRRRAPAGSRPAGGGGIRRHAPGASEELPHREHDLGDDSSSVSQSSSEYDVDNDGQLVFSAECDDDDEFKAKALEEHERAMAAELGVQPPHLLASQEAGGKSRSSSDGVRQIRDTRLTQAPLRDEMRPQVVEAQPSQLPLLFPSAVAAAVHNSATAAMRHELRTLPAFGRESLQTAEAHPARGQFAAPVGGGNTYGNRQHRNHLGGQRNLVEQAPRTYLPAHSRYSADDASESPTRGDVQENSGGSPPSSGGDNARDRISAMHSRRQDMDDGRSAGGANAGDDAEVDDAFVHHSSGGAGRPYAGALQRAAGNGGVGSGAESEEFQGVARRSKPGRGGGQSGSKRFSAALTGSDPIDEVAWASAAAAAGGGAAAADAGDDTEVGTTTDEGKDAASPRHHRGGRDASAAEATGVQMLRAASDKRQRHPRVEAAHIDLRCDAVSQEPAAPRRTNATEDGAISEIRQAIRSVEREMALVKGQMERLQVPGQPSFEGPSAPGRDAPAHGASAAACAITAGGKTTALSAGGTEASTPAAAESVALPVSPTAHVVAGMLLVEVAAAASTAACSLALAVGAVRTSREEEVAVLQKKLQRLQTSWRRFNKHLQDSCPFSWDCNGKETAPYNSSRDVPQQEKRQPQAPKLHNPAARWRSKHKQSDVTKAAHNSMLTARRCDANSAPVRGGDGGGRDEGSSSGDDSQADAMPALHLTGTSPRAVRTAVAAHALRGIPAPGAASHSLLELLMPPPAPGGLLPPGRDSDTGRADGATSDSSDDNRPLALVARSSAAAALPSRATGGAPAGATLACSRMAWLGNDGGWARGTDGRSRMAAERTADGLQWVAAAQARPLAAQAALSAPLSLSHLLPARTAIAPGVPAAAGATPAATVAVDAGSAGQHLGGAGIAAPLTGTLVAAADARPDSMGKAGPSASADLAQLRATAAPTVTPPGPKVPSPANAGSAGPAARPWQVVGSTALARPALSPMRVPLAGCAGPVEAEQDEGDMIPGSPCGSESA